MGPSIEQTLQGALEKIVQHPVILQAASRTDAGVHALGQVVNFFTSNPIESGRLIFSLNRLLPKDIVVSSIEEVSPSFHPTLHCRGKEYRYYVCYDVFQPPHQRFYEWHVPFPLDVEEMKRAIPYLLGEHDFAAFCNFKMNTNYPSTIRRIDQIILEEHGHRRLIFSIKGNNFLYRMVRNVVGTLIHIGKAKIKKEEIPAILQSEKRANAGITAPAHALFLQSVFY